MNSEDIFPRGGGDADAYGYPGEKRYVGVDKPVIEYGEDAIADWANHPSNDWELGDQMGDHSDDQGWD